MLRRTTTPSAELESTTGGRFSAPGLTTTTGFASTARRRRGRAHRGAAASGDGRLRGHRLGGRLGPTIRQAASDAASGSVTPDVFTASASRRAGSPRAAKNAAMRASCSACDSSFIIALCSFCISDRTASSGDAGSYSIFFDARIVPSKKRCV